MIRPAIIPCLMFLAGFATAADQPDLLRFTNGDQLHGFFRGIKEGPRAVWQRDDVTETVDFRTTQLRHVVLHGGRPLKSLSTLSHVGLVNGDRVPGTVTALDDDTVTLDTSYAGVLRIPRKQVSMLAPSPLGGRVHYHGPFAEDGWKMVNASHQDGMPPEEMGNDSKEDEKPGRWVFSGSAWYWQNKRAGTALIRETGMPERAVLAFDLAWKNRLAVAIAFHADFMHPKQAADGEDSGNQPRRFVAGDPSALPYLFGNSYVLQLYPNYLILYRTIVDEDGKPSFERIQSNQSNMRIGETGLAKVELRTNRLSGGISLFINGEFVAQWSEGDTAGREAAGYAGKGGGFGMIVMGDDSPVRISDVIVSEWNGMPDSARSLQADDHDIVLMTNGTDRFAGKVGHFENGKILFEGKHGTFQFPFDEIAEIRFARNRLAAPVDEPPDNLVVRLSPIGSVSGRPLSGDGSTLRMLNPVAGELDLSLDSAVMLDFNSSNQIIDDWDANF